jgi:GNAT superfamily N-acetyltransferase
VDLTVRAARPDDAGAVAAFTEDTWPDREVGDYLPDVFPEWVADDDPDRLTLVADDDDDRAVAVIGGRRLTDREAWVQGLRVRPDYRDRGVGSRLLEAVLDWARDGGAEVCRGLVFSWNVASLALTRSVGFDPRTEFRWAEVAADPDAAPSSQVVGDPDSGWAFWTASEARDHLRGLALDAGQAWSLSELRPDDLEHAAETDGLFVVRDGGTRGLSLRTRIVDGDGPDRWAEYAVGAWADVDTARALVDAVARDAASKGADRARMLVPETPRFVTDAAAAGADVSGHPDFVLAADLT